MSAPYYTDESVTLWHGDCLDVLRAMPDASVDAIVTDPPYGLEFMGKEWDKFGDVTRANRGTQPARKRPEGEAGESAKFQLPSPAFDLSRTALRSFQQWCEDWSAECLRVLKPGGHLLAFGGTRTWHRLACAVEDAGFEIRDSIAWLFGSGFPKSLDVSKAIDKAAGAEREVVGPGRWNSVKGLAGKDGGLTLDGFVSHGGTQHNITAPATPDAEKWQGWGTALKPAFEPIVVGRKPLAGTVAANVLTRGTGAINVDGCRVAMSAADASQIESMTGFGVDGYTRQRTEGTFMQGTPKATVAKAHDAGRWPTNVVLDESQAAELDRQSGTLTSGLFKPEHADHGKAAGTLGAMSGRERTATYGGDSGGASRFFPTFHYEAKAPTSQRPRHGETAHPTVKPVDLMRWLVRLVTPPGGTVLDPFAGSGTTAEACVVEGFRCVLIEREADYLPLIVQRLTKPIAPVLDFGASA